ncbi:putative zinc finger protein [Herbihabitans rhizosphaerae]|uniref:Putative zinc finger protein n=1 Tax=Herbihabitans rhizosphaerae TaxID=1872711 RepID=A0A4Q7L7F1_9PSEU|nr:zf-HC2 domain-containing protein [Herbihabitans rhizosphaerae]RZS44282.1 putative zinc finger protein [Herbihabitans rhizosphaerae]
MTELRGWSFSEQHLLPDAVVAFVDGELSATVTERVATHAARCPACAAEIKAQRTARSAVRSADAPSLPAGLLANLRAIPQSCDLPSSPDGLAMTADGQMVVVQRPDRAAALAKDAPLGTSAPLGSSPKLGEGSTVLGRAGGMGRRAGAGVVVSGLMIGALALALPGSGEEPQEQGRPAITGDLNARFGGHQQSPAPPAPTSSPALVPAVPAGR